MGRLSTSDIVIIACVVFTGLVTIAVSDINISHQNTVNKQFAAKQMLIEIESLNPTLQEYSDFYRNGLDLEDDNGENQAVVLDTNNFFIINSKNGSSIPFIVQINNSGIFPKQTKINSINNGSISITYPDITITPNIVRSVKLGTPLIPPPLYNEHGVYYTFTREISNFNGDETRDLFLFYNKLTKAEYDRASLQTYFDTNGYDSELNGQYFNTYMDMRLNIMYAAMIAPHIIEELEKEANSTSMFF
ncbi:hypothetical protein RSJ42_08840 [Methanosarcina hadiensis]|uniref:hypothetical protein n=1 Tax=Methanosarcina hadiensis TaxID=3078083 RepID=UPI0039778BBF